MDPQSQKGSEADEQQHPHHQGRAQIYYKDWGSGQPIVPHHGWRLSADDWDAQMMFFLTQGYRVIAHDRRGHGRSSQTETGNEMDTYAADVAELAEYLDLRNAGPHRTLDRRGHASLVTVVPAAKTACTMA